MFQSELALAMPHDYGSDPAIRWLGPYAQTESDDMTKRHADQETVSHIIALRKQIEELQEMVKQLTNHLQLISDHTTDGAAKIVADLIISQGPMYSERK